MEGRKALTVQNKARVFTWKVRSISASIVDQDIDGATLYQRLRRDRCYILSLRQVTYIDVCRVASRSKLSLCLAETVSINIPQHQRGPGIGQLRGQQSADAAGGAGNQGAPAFYIRHVRVPVNVAKTVPHRSFAGLSDAFSRSTIFLRKAMG
jgi:hypothetical protein